MSTITRFRGGALTPFDWSNLSWFPLLAPSIRIEDHLDGDHYGIRAELPGIDPARDLRITYARGELRLDVARKETKTDKGRSEFHYGSFFRVIPLPAGIKEETIVARYVDGILEITAAVGAAESTVTEIPIKLEDGKKH